MAKACPLFCVFDAARLLIVSLGLIRKPLTSLSTMDPAVFSFLIKEEPRGKAKEKTSQSENILVQMWMSAGAWRGSSVGLQVFLQQVCWGVRLLPLSTIIFTWKRGLDFYWPPSHLPIDYLISVMKSREEEKKATPALFRKCWFLLGGKHTFCLTAGV